MIDCHADRREPKPPTLVARLEHALIPARDEAALRALPEIMTRPCFVPPLKRVALETWKGRSLRHTRISVEAIRAYLQDPQCDVVDMDSGRHEDLTASARIFTGLILTPDYWEAYPAPMEPYVIVPHDPALTRARINAFCELAVALRVTAGCVSVELGFVMALNMGVGASSQPDELMDRQPGLTIRRLRERSAYDKRTLDREVPSPEWGLFLSTKHLEVVPAARLEASGVFHEVRRLADDLVFVQLTPDPIDALREDYDAMLDGVRDVLAPILADRTSPSTSSEGSGT